jgi:hypothetical protein
LYDYIRLELTGYVPPTPAGLTAIAGNGVVVLDWPASSGATSYTVSRSTTSGSGYTAIATNVIGPVVGSDVPDATYTDNSVANGTPYYYVVAAVNPNGSSTNSVEASATPSASTPLAPSAPIGLTVTPGNLQATLTWNASSGAATYTIQRTVITAAPTPTTPEPKRPSCRTVPCRRIPSTASSPPPITPTPAWPTTCHLRLYRQRGQRQRPERRVRAGQRHDLAELSNDTHRPHAMVSSNQVNLSWNPVATAEDYVLQRATSISGPYTAVDDPDVG